MPHPFPYIPISSAMPHPRQQPRPLTPLPTPFSQRLSSSDTGSAAAHSGDQHSSDTNGSAAAHSGSPSSAQ
ncbi:unnamed protein product, partial [Ilex paraguariensis]